MSWISSLALKTRIVLSVLILMTASFVISFVVQHHGIGLMGDTETTLGSVLDGSKVALVLGSEGDGMRHNVMEHCDVLAKLPISPRMESLNISNAAAIALYAVATAGR